ncbi:25S rRNA (adenine645-N1)-methyltransferase, partial [Perkinsus olseni]
MACDSSYPILLTSPLRMRVKLLLSFSVLDEQFVRNYQFFGEKGQNDIMNARVVVVGLGGVGSHTAVTLARSGI